MDYNPGMVVLIINFIFITRVCHFEGKFGQISEYGSPSPHSIGMLAPTKITLIILLLVVTGPTALQQLWIIT